MAWKDFDGPATVDKRQRLVTGYISTIDVDMDGDVVLPQGMNEEPYFATTKSVNLCHDADAAIGTCRHLAKRAKGIYATTYITKTQLGEDVLTMIEEGVLRGFSIEWDPRTLVAGPPTLSEKSMYGDCKQVFRQWDLLRYAVTPRPANPNCYVDGVKDTSRAEAMQPIWEAMKSMFDGGRISRSSAVAAGFPDTSERKFHAVTTPKVRRATLVDGAYAVR